MDTKTQYLATLRTLTDELNACQSRAKALASDLQTICAQLTRGEDVGCAERAHNLQQVVKGCEGIQEFIVSALTSRIPLLRGGIETLTNLLNNDLEDRWRVTQTAEVLSASETVDRLTDAITEHLLAHNADPKPPRIRFIDNPDAFVADFVATYLDHPINNRMSDTVISLVNDWIAFRLTT